MAQLHLNSYLHAVDSIATEINTNEQKNEYYYSEIQRQSNMFLKENVKTYHNSITHLILKKIPIFHPSGRFKAIWDYIIVLLILYTLFSVPFQWAFIPSTSSNLFYYKNLNIVIDCFFLLDVVFCFNTAYKDPISLNYVKSRMKIFWRYLRFWFWIDLVSSLPWDYINHQYTEIDPNTNFLILLRILRIVRISRIGGLLQNINTKYFHQLVLLNPQIPKIGLLALQIIIISHVWACIWFYIAISNKDDQYALTVDLVSEPLNWVSFFGFADATNNDKYISSLYFTMYTLTTIGFGDIHATNLRERLVAIFMMLTGSITMGALIASIARLMASSDPLLREFDLQMNELKNYLVHKRLNRSFKLTVIEAYRFYLSKKTQFQESSALQELPSTLFIQLSNSIYSNEIRRVSLFRNEFSEALVAELLYHSKPFVVVPEEEILRQGNVSLDIYFILQGVISITFKIGRKVGQIGFVTSGKYFGDLEYYYRTLSFATYTSVTNCVLIRIDLNSFHSVLANYPIEKEKFANLCKTRYEAFGKVAHDSMMKHWDDKAYIAAISSKVSIKSSFAKRNSFQRNHSLPFSSFSFAKSSNNINSDEIIEIVYWPVLWIDGLIKSRRDVLDSDISQIKSYRRALVMDTSGKEVVIECSRREMWYKYRIIHPDTDFKFIWEFFVYSVIIYCVLVNPVHAAFTLTDKVSNVLEILDLIVDAIFLLDVFITCRSSIYDNSREAWILIPWKLWRHYYQSWFIVDLLSSIPFNVLIAESLYSNNASTRVAELIQLIRIAKLSKMRKILNIGRTKSFMISLETHLRISPSTIEIFSVFLMIVFISHLVACMWWGISTYVDSNQTWYLYPYTGEYNENIYKDLLNADFVNQYITSLYWAVTTLTTVGYGDIVPVNYQERILSIAVFVIGATVFGYIIGKIGNVVGSMTFSEISERLYEIRSYLIQKKCSSVLSKSILRYYKYKFEHLTSASEEVFFSRLPRHLSNELYLSQYKSEIEKISLFKYISDDSIKVYLFKMLNAEFYDRGQFILRNEDLNISFLSEGTIVLSSIENSRLENIKSLKKGFHSSLQSSQLNTSNYSINSDSSNTTTRRERLQMHFSLNISLLNKEISMLEDELLIESIDKISFRNYEPNSRITSSKVVLGEIGQGFLIGSITSNRNSKFILSAQAKSSCLIYTLRLSRLNQILVDQPQVSFYLQYALGKVQHELEIEIGENNLRYQRLTFLNFIKLEFIAYRKKETKQLFLKYLVLHKQLSKIPSKIDIIGSLSDVKGFQSIKELRKFTDLLSQEYNSEIHVDDISIKDIENDIDNTLFNRFYLKLESIESQLHQQFDDGITYIQDLFRNGNNGYDSDDEFQNEVKISTSNKSSRSLKSIKLATLRPLSIDSEFAVHRLSISYKSNASFFKENFQRRLSFPSIKVDEWKNFKKHEVIKRL